MNVDELYSIIALPKPKPQYQMNAKMNEKKSKKIKKFLDQINIFGGSAHHRRDSTVTACTVVSVK
jgi:hypothetical protein